MAKIHGIHCKLRNGFIDMNLALYKPCHVQRTIRAIRYNNKQLQHSIEIKGLNPLRLSQPNPTDRVAIIYYSDVIMGAMVSQITSLVIVYLTVPSDADQRKHESSASLALVRGIHRWPMNSPHKGLVTRKTFPFDDVIMTWMKVWCSLKANIMIHSRATSRATPLLRHMAPLSMGLVAPQCLPSMDATLGPAARDQLYPGV